MYHPDAPMLWIEGLELLTGAPRWVPYEMVHTAYTLPRPTGTGCFIATSNGLASGNHLLEAISHAICETVERDAATLHSVRAPRDAASRRIDPKTVDNPDCLEGISTGSTGRPWRWRSGLSPPTSAFRPSPAG